jgi:hypothetical protein
MEFQATDAYAAKAWTTQGRHQYQRLATVETGDEMYLLNEVKHFYFFRKYRVNVIIKTEYTVI